MVFIYNLTGLAAKGGTLSSYCWVMMVSFTSVSSSRVLVFFK